MENKVVNETAVCVIFSYNFASIEFYQYILESYDYSIAQNENIQQIYS